MKIFCVSGGNYKSFYLNAFLKIKGYDLLIINFGIMYDIKENLDDSNIVFNELKMLYDRAKVPIIAGVKIGQNRIKKFILCNHGKCHIYSLNTGIILNIKNKKFVVGEKFTKYGNNNKIILSETRVYPEISHCSYKKTYVFCDNFGITKIEKRKISRKFYKYAKIILK